MRLAEGDVDGALSGAAPRVGGLAGLDAPYEAARVRVRIGAGMPGARRPRRARRVELDAARDVFERLGAAPDLARLDRSGRATPLPSPAGLSEREVEVLRLVAAGLTNRAIADALTISERTVDRHVSNIFTKLDVSTRAAATAFAYEHGLV